jgi:hypothetical protein
MQAATRESTSLPGLSSFAHYWKSVAMDAGELGRIKG